MNFVYLYKYIYVYIGFDMTSAAGRRPGLLPFNPYTEARPPQDPFRHLLATFPSPILLSYQEPPDFW